MIHCNPFTLFGGEWYCECKVFCKDHNTMTWPGLEPRPLNLQSYELTIGYHVSHD